MLLCTIGSAVNMLLSLRTPSISLSTLAIQLIAYPIGLGWDLIFPDRVFTVFGIKFNLKPGSFNFKEHVIIVVMSNVRLAFCYVKPAANSFFLRLRMAVVLCMLLMSFLLRRSGTNSHSAGPGKSSSASRHSALAMGLPVWQEGSWFGPLP